MLVMMKLHLYAAAIDDCRYRLVEQPPKVIACNPYPVGKFVTRCVVEFSTEEGIPPHLAWYTRAQLGGPSRRIYSGYLSRYHISSVESELTVHLTKEMENSFTVYFCQVAFCNGTVLSDSQEGYLFPADALSNTFTACDEKGVQATKEVKCIDPRPIPTTPSSIPMTSSSNSPPVTMKVEFSQTLPQTATTSGSLTTIPQTDSQTTIHTDLPISTPTNPPTIKPPRLPTIPPNDPLTTIPLHPSKISTQTDPPTTSPPDLLPPSTVSPDLLQTTPTFISMSSDSTPALVNSPNSAINIGPPLELQSVSSHSALPQAQPTGSSPPPDAGTSGETFDDEVLLFLTVGATIFILIIVYFIIFCLCLWSRQCRECSYNFCCSEDCCCCCVCCLDDV